MSVVRRINLNPEKKDKVLKKLKLYQKMGKLVPHTLKRGYERNIYSANGVPIEIYKRKDSNPQKLILIVHGGVFIMGLMNTYRNLHLEIGKVIDNAAVVVFDYRIVPDHRYPAAHDDMDTAWEFVQTELGYNPRGIVLMGDSSGGNLILSLLLKLRDGNRPMPAAAAVMSPWTDLSASGESYKKNYNNDIIFGRRKSALDEEKIEKLRKCGVFSYAEGTDRNNPYLSPVLGEYHGMPPVLMTAGSHEMLLDDTLTVAEKIKAAGGEVRVIIGEGMFHSYPLFYMLSPAAKKTFKEVLLFLKEHTS